jgi:hypothetical protein
MEGHLTDETENQEITAYYGSNKFREGARFFQREIGKTYEHKGKVEVYESGFEACEYPLHVFNYYPPAGSRFFLVTQSGAIDRSDNDTRSASERITIDAELSLLELAARAVKWVFDRAKPEEGLQATGSRSSASTMGAGSAASATGELGAAIATGDNSAASATGELGAAAATGGNSAAAALGDLGSAAATGRSSAASVTGIAGAACATGDDSAACAAGLYGAASATGWNSAACATGEGGAASATAPHGVASATGERGAASATSDECTASATGERGAASATGGGGNADVKGSYSAASATGDDGVASATGDGGAATATGDRGAASATGNSGAAMSIGISARAMGAEGNALFLVYRNPDDGEIIHVWAGIAGRDGIKPKTWYKLDEDGKLIELGGQRSGATESYVVNPQSEKMTGTGTETS